jgi:hypothetical protein
VRVTEEFADQSRRIAALASSGLGDTESATIYLGRVACVEVDAAVGRDALGKTSEWVQLNGLTQGVVPLDHRMSRTISIAYRQQP